jgi:hypothetical protein
MQNGPVKTENTLPPLPAFLMIYDINILADEQLEEYADGQFSESLQNSN